MSSIVKTLEAAASAKGEYRVGGTDVMDRHRHHVSGGDIVDMARIPGLDDIRLNSDGTCLIGAWVSIHRVATDPIIRTNYPGLAKTAGALANPQIRRAASMGGSLLQRSRCWYFRHEEFTCFKNGGDSCPAREGNHQYGVCFDLGPCVWPHPSTLGMALMAYDAQITIHGKENMKITQLFGDGKAAQYDHLLPQGAILTGILLPAPIQNEVNAYHRTISRARAEWPLVEVLVIGNSKEASRIHDPRVVIGGVANVPLRLKDVEAYLQDRNPRRGVYQEAGRLATLGANPLPGTKYKVEMVAKAVEIAIENTFSSLESD